MAAMVRIAGAFLLIGLFAAEAAAQRTVLDGVYSAAQAARGREAYAAHCGDCHGPELHGGPEPPPLRGPVFLNRWREDGVDSLFLYTKNQMPPLARNSLGDETYLDIVAHILRTNGFPVGSTSLTVSELVEILVVGLSGPQPLPTNTIVRTSGCLTAADGVNEWTLTRASKPGRVRRPGSLPGDGAVMRDSLGSETFQLMNHTHVFPRFEPKAHVNKKVRVEGALFTGNRISLTKVEVLSETCTE
jgi:mono/diheme cytochrome c family protein